MHYIVNLVQSADIDGLKKYWDYLVTKFANVCYSPDDIALRKMEIGLYRFYVIHMVQNSKTKEMNVFFQKMTQVGKIVGRLY